MYFVHTLSFVNVTYMSAYFKRGESSALPVNEDIVKRDIVLISDIPHLSLIEFNEHMMYGIIAGSNPLFPVLYWMLGVLLVCLL